MLKKDGKEISEILQKAKDHIEIALAKHLAEYSEYGMDDIANELIMIAASIECTKLRVDYALIKEGDEYNA